MNANLKIHAAIVAAALAVAACAAPEMGTPRGKLYFGQFDAKMDEADRMNAVRAVQTNETVSWRNEKSGHEFTVKPTRTFYSGSNICRDYTLSATIEGRPDKLDGSACKQSDAGWVARGAG